MGASHIGHSGSGGTSPTRGHSRGVAICFAKTPGARRGRPSLPGDSDPSWTRGQRSESPDAAARGPNFSPGTDILALGDRHNNSERRVAPARGGGDPKYPPPRRDGTAPARRPCKPALARPAIPVGGVGFVPGLLQAPSWHQCQLLCWDAALGRGGAWLGVPGVAQSWGSSLGTQQGAGAPPPSPARASPSSPSFLKQQ